MMALVKFISVVEVVDVVASIVASIVENIAATVADVLVEDIVATVMAAKEVVEVVTAEGTVKAVREESDEAEADSVEIEAIVEEKADIVEVDEVAAAIVVVAVVMGDHPRLLQRTVDGNSRRCDKHPRPAS